MNATWDDLILPKVQRRQLDKIVAEVRQIPAVPETRRAGARRGPGITALFAGPSGTGKTMATELLDNELHLNIYRIDLRNVVSRYLSETEKDLQQLLDVAVGRGSILYFEGADALFGKRSEVKDSHDRYGSAGAGYLLQRLEAYPGLSIMTTTKKEVIDAAFLRRLRFVINFPFPGVEARKQIWYRNFPPVAVNGEIDFDKLAQLNVTGGVIRIIAEYAMFLAADMGDPLLMKHLYRATKIECSKREIKLPDELKGWLNS